MNAGDLGSCWAVCACAYDAIHVTAHGKRLGFICACVPLVSRFYAVRSIKTMPSMWIHLLCACSFPHGVTWILCPNMGIVTSIKSHGLNTRFWLVEINFAALWLVSTSSSLLHYLRSHEYFNGEERKNLIRIHYRLTNLVRRFTKGRRRCEGVWGGGGTA